MELEAFPAYDACVGPQGARRTRPGLGYWGIATLSWMHFPITAGPTWAPSPSGYLIIFPLLRFIWYATEGLALQKVW